MAQDPVPGDLIWHTFQGGALADRAFAVDRDPAGNLYLVGHGESDWDMTGQASIAPVNNHTAVIHDNRRFDVFVAKFTAEGTLVWYSFIGDGGSNDYGWDIAVDTDGEVFVVGQTSNWYELGGWKEENRAFLAKFDSNGTFLWMHKMGTRASPNDNAGAVDIDASGNVYVMGSSIYGWNWDDGTTEGKAPINPFIDAYGSNYFVAGFNNAGDYQWHTFIGPHAVENSMNLVVKGSTIYLAGASYFRFAIPGVTPAIDHDHGHSEDRICQEGFALKMNTSGQISWYSYLGYDYNQAPLNSGDGAWPFGIDADLAGNIYITGNSSRTFLHAPPPLHEKHAFGDPDCFVMKINSNDHTTNCIRWSTFWSYSLNDRGEDIKLDPYGNVFIGANGLSSSNVMIMLDNNGNKQWLRGLWDYPGTGLQQSIALDESGSLFFAGYSGTPWEGSLGGSVIHEHQTEWYEEAFLAKMHTGVDYTAPPVLYVDKEFRTSLPGYVDNSGRLFHPDMAGVTLSVNMGSVAMNPDGTWQWSINDAGLVAGNYPITITASDGNGGSSEITFTLKITDTPEEKAMAQAIWWLVREQRDDGSWGGLPYYPDIQVDEPVTSTGWALTVLCSYAYDLGYSPFSESFPYSANAKAAYDYLFSQAKRPGWDVDNSKLFVYEYTESPDYELFGTAAALMAISASRTPEALIEYPENPLVDGLTFLELTNMMVNYLHHFQYSDPGDEQYGGWEANEFRNGNILRALSYAKAFGSTLPDNLLPMLESYVNNHNDAIWQGPGKMQRFASLLVGMELLDDDMSPESRAESALEMIQNVWGSFEVDWEWDDKQMYLLYSLMRAFTSFNVDHIDVGGNPVNWYDMISNQILNLSAQNSEEGYWIFCAAGDRLYSTCWALLTLLKAGPYYDNLPPVIATDNVTITVDEGMTATNSGTVSDPDGDAITLTASLGTLITNGDGTWSWSYPAGDGPADNHTIMITVDDGIGLTNAVSFDLIVNNVAPEIDNIILPLDPVALSDQPVQLTVEYTDPAELNDAPFDCLFAFGDGTSEIVQSTALTASVLHTYAEPGEYTVIATVTDKDGGIETESSPQKITIYNQPPSVNVHNDLVSVNEGLIAHNSGTVTDPEGDDVTLSANMGNITNNGDGSWSWDFQTSDGPFSQEVTISGIDSEGGSSEISFTLAVNNVAPEIDNIILPLDPVALSDQPVQLTVEYTDPAGLNDAPFDCLFAFSDGYDETFESSELSAVAEHTFANAGVYTVSVTVTDKDDGSDHESVSQYVVIYDPSDGFVTGGGWIVSPEGASRQYPSATGKANFGFVSKYKKGSSVPTGNTEFQFKAGDLNFNSYEYYWLVIAGSRAAFKGAGTINGAGEYGFLLSAIDADLSPSTDMDKFRIKIWELGNDLNVIYDNELNEEVDEATPTTDISGGSIVIHTKDNLKDEELTESFARVNIYPNPFDHSMDIDLFSEVTQSIIIDMIDMNGREVEHLYKGGVVAGVDHRFEFNIKADLEPGPYMLRIRGDNGALLGREIMIKR